MQPFSIEIALDGGGVRAVRVYGKCWEQPQAYALLERIGPLIQQLDVLVRGESPPERPVSPKESAQ
jgi:hypothetical protein